MRVLRHMVVIFFTLFILVGCAPSLAQENSNDIRYAKLEKLSIENQTDIILDLSNSVNVSKQITANLLTPKDPIWKGERQESDPLFDGFKYEILLHDVIPELTPKQKFREPIIFENSAGLITAVQGSYPPDDSLAIIYVGIGEQSAKIGIKDIGRNKVQISIYK